jgi:N-acetylglutamate synthase-like GNAT family acetyltransferase
MKIIDCDEQRQPIFFACLESWSEEIKEAGDHKRQWYEQMKSKGLRVKLAMDDDGVAGGMIQYAPIEHSFAEGRDLCFIYCIWVHGHKQGCGNFQKRGMGTALLEAAESDVMAMGYKGIAAWGVRGPFWMRAAWFKKHGYSVADKDRIRVLLWKPFVNDAVAPRWVKPSKSPSLISNKVTVTALRNGWCPGMNVVFERAKRAAMESDLKGKVEFREVDTSDRSVFAEWGTADALFVNEKQVHTGPPPSFEKIRRIIRRRAKRVQVEVNIEENV